MPHVVRVESNQSVTVVRLGGVTRELAGVYSCKVSTNTQELVSRARGIPDAVTIDHLVAFQSCYKDKECCQVNGLRLWGVGLCSLAL